ncbi:MAG: non-ribosomal peptide synthetase [Steroidobacteraceae bacterium]|jgi:acyl-CoA synthetase (AMP-forming)/AMP-acid ligase II|nr:non-ribosomal peptide synthetase [Steroidobacteraceae bacterium]
MQHQTLIDVLESNRRVDRNVRHLIGEHEERVVPYAELYERAVGILWHLQKLGAQRGDKLIVFLNDNEQFLDGFWAALAGGIVPVPLAVGIADEHRHKLLRIAKRLGDPFLYTDRKNLERLKAFAATVGEGPTFAKLERRAFVVDDLEDISQAGRTVQPGPDDVAFIQFSSGSTSEPKGVVLTHRNILANTRGATVAANFNEGDVSLSWMPLTHDMGLIGKHLFMLANRIENLLMPTELFIRRPLLWTTFATRYGATVLSSPNFGYRHYLKVLGERPLDGVDLSRVRVIFNGAEPISVELCDEFVARLAPRGLRKSAMFPVYGLAEATLAVSFPALGTEYSSITVDRHRLGVGESARAVEASHRDALALMAVGRPIPGTEVRIAAEDRSALPDGTVGHLLIRGENVTKGYYELPEVNARTITPDGWLDTGDLGLVRDGHLYITGRAKEIIFVNGQNYYPHDLEAIAQRASGLELGKVVATGCRPRGAETDELTIFVLHRGDLAEFLPVAAEVSRLVNEHAGLEVAHVVPVKRIPKTTSGKIQRVALETAFVDGEFDVEMAELRRLREAAASAGDGVAAGGGVAGRLRAIVENALPGRQIGVEDNLFEIGASSLTLIQIHEEIDKVYPNLVDLTELFDYPTIAQLSAHLESKLR